MLIPNPIPMQKTDEIEAANEARLMLSFLEFLTKLQSWDHSVPPVVKVMGEGKLWPTGATESTGSTGLGSGQVSAQIIQGLHAHVFPLQKSQNNDENQQSSIL